MTNKRWDYLYKASSQSKISELSEKLKLPAAIACVLVNRGIDTEEAARTFLGKSIAGVHHPFDLKDAQKAGRAH